MGAISRTDPHRAAYMQMYIILVRIDRCSLKLLLCREHKLFLSFGIPFMCFPCV